MSMTPEALEQLTQKIRDQLEETIIEKVTRQLMLSISQMQSQGLALPPDPEVGLSDARVNKKESCVDPLGQDPYTRNSEKCQLYVDENPPRLVALGRLYEGSTTVHNVPLGNDQVKVGVEEVRDADTDADACVLVPTQEV